MNQSHSKLTDWGLQHVPIGRHFTILDVGCGGGRALQKLAALAPKGKLYGVDYAAGSVATARAKNAALIQTGQVVIQLASVSQLPFPDNQFDLVTAIETQYYWPDLANDMKEIRRVLKPGGTLLVIAESYKRGRFDAMKLLRAISLSVQEHQELFAAAGYVMVQSKKNATKAGFAEAGKSRPPFPASDRSGGVRSAQRRTWGDVLSRRTGLSYAVQKITKPGNEARRWARIFCKVVI
ncbi:MAG: class I SAM-dependent methyltransferase [Blastocatellia bacterium]